MFIALRAGAEEWITQLANMTNTDKVSEQLEDSFKDKRIGEDIDLAARYFSTVKQSRIVKLYEIYRIDFDLFGYKHKNYVVNGIPD